jgi:uncharacterized lipoprotein YddW (UPF0748 family)
VRPSLTARAVLSVALAALVACGGSSEDRPLTREARPTTTTSAAPDADPPPDTEPPAAEPPATTEAPGPARTELPRPLLATWVHLFDDSLKTPAGVDQVLDDAAGAGLNAVFVQVVRRHDGYYDSRAVPRTPDPGLAGGFDVLDAVIRGGHRRGLQVHAWFNVAPALHHAYDRLTLPPGHLWLDHGPDSAESWMTVDHGGRTSREYLDVGVPGVQEHAVAVLTDIASRYPVDGVHVDYVRYDGPEWGYHPQALARFAEETGRTDRPAPGDGQWAAWRREQPTALVRALREALRRTRPEALLSVPVFGLGAGPASAPGGFDGTWAHARLMQDWPRWVREGLVDLAIPMAYLREHDAEQRQWYREWTAFAGELDRAHPEVSVAMGLGAWLNDVPASLTQVDQALAATAGAVLFSYQQDSRSDPPRALLRALAERR